MKQIFVEKQKKVTYTKSGKALICVNEKEIIENEIISYEYDTEWVQPVQKTELSVIEALKSLVCERIKAYDISDNVNSFNLYGNKLWIDKNTRMGLRVNIADDILAEKETSTFWFNNNSFEAPCEVVLQMLIKLESYAKECYDITQQHYLSVSQLDTIEDVFSFDITSGYPDILIFNYPCQ